ncbi:MAG: Spy/CpxP family protein refolding chaperone [Proteobacteria bacterium]|nr:Spy/CpxP family protein refolding chaperone [Pseudomonadota bacterium]
MTRWIAILALLATALPVAAEPGEGRGFGPRHHRRGPPPLHHVLERNADRLGLDASTLAEIRAIGEASRERADRLRDEIRDLHDEMRDLIDRDAPDEPAVMRQAERIGAARTEAHKERLATMLRVRALLTREQRQALVELHRERREERRGRRGPPGGDPSRTP